MDIKALFEASPLGKATVILCLCCILYAVHGLATCGESEHAVAEAKLGGLIAILMIIVVVLMSWWQLW